MRSPCSEYQKRNSLSETKPWPLGSICRCGGRRAVRRVRPKREAQRPSGGCGGTGPRPHARLSELPVNVRPDLGRRKCYVNARVVWLAPPRCDFWKNWGGSYRVRIRRVGQYPQVRHDVAHGLLQGRAAGRDGHGATAALCAQAGARPEQPVSLFAPRVFQARRTPGRERVGTLSIFPPRE